MERWVSLSGLDASDPRRRAALGDHGDRGGDTNITQGQGSEGTGPQVSLTEPVLYPAMEGLPRAVFACRPGSTFVGFCLHLLMLKTYDRYFCCWFVRAGHCSQCKVLSTAVCVLGRA